jgi:predicted MPP superfamily phosphohydrolase
MLGSYEPPPEPRAPSRLPLVLAVLVVLGLAGLAVRAFVWEPGAVELTRHAIKGTVQSPLRIAHITDLHLADVDTRDLALVASVVAEKPDLIVFTGDATVGPHEKAREFFRNLQAPLGVWVVPGERETAARAEAAAFFESVGARFLVNAGALVRPDVWIAGVDDPVTGQPEMTKALEGAPAAAFKLALFHAPDYFSEVAGLFNLALAGHTHGGQVRLPGIGPLWLPDGGRTHPAGWYTENRSALYVNRGVGTTGTPARLFCRPEIAIIDVTPGG